MKIKSSIFMHLSKTDGSAFCLCPAIIFYNVGHRGFAISLAWLMFEWYLLFKKH